MATNDAGDDAVTVMATVMATVVITAEIDATATDLPSNPTLDGGIATSAAAETTASSSALETSSAPVLPTQSAVNSAALKASQLTSAVATSAAPRTTSSSLSTESPTLVISTSSRLPEVILPPLSATSISVPLSVTQASSTLATSTSSSISATSTTNVVAAAKESTAATTVNSNSRQQAFIGGLAGAVGGAFFVVIFLLLCACNRRRRARRRGTVNRATISGPRPASPSAMSAFGPYPYVVDPKRGSAKSYKTADGTLIRVDTENFSRPYAEKASWRELAGAGRLHVMNPDKSAPVTPEVGTDRMAGFINSKKTSPTMVTTTEVSPDRPAALSRHTTSHSITGAPRLPEVARTPPIVMHHHAEEDFYQTRYARPTVQHGTPREMSTTIGHAFRPHVNGRFSGSDYSTDTSYRESNVSDPFQLESPYVSSGARFVMQRSPNDARSSPMGVYNYR